MKIILIEYGRMFIVHLGMGKCLIENGKYLIGNEKMFEVLLLQSIAFFS